MNLVHWKIVISLHSGGFLLQHVGGHIKSIWSMPSFLFLYLLLDKD